MALTLRLFARTRRTTASTPEPPHYARRIDTTALILSAVGGVVAIVLLISWAKLHPFLSLMVASLGVGLGAGLSGQAALDSFAKGFGSTMAGVGLLIGLGAMLGKLLADSGGADSIVDALLARTSRGQVPWVMSLVGALLGLPMFFEIGVVLLMPVVVLVAERSRLRPVAVAIPALAGLSAMHGLVPPHPGPLIAVAALNANVGTTLLLGLLVAVPCVVLAGPVFGRFAASWAGDVAPSIVPPAPPSERQRRRPSFAAATACVLLPAALMLCREAGQLVAPKSHSLPAACLDFLGSPPAALAIGVFGAMLLLRMPREEVSKSLEGSLGPIAGVLFIVGGGGGFKQVLIDTGVANWIATVVPHSSSSILLVAWAIAALIRVATGSATVATTTAAGVLAPVVAGLPPTLVALAVLAIGSGSLFLSHVNDAGFWLVKGYLGTDVRQTFQTWSAMECVLSATGLVLVLSLAAVLG
ncbi:MAG: GntP family permease [Segniliparus sp.]|uniref:GntP family permease n=1 Tax=Segniliparus sp. TaxID=2804064 RepID=UPI003F3B7C90